MGLESPGSLSMGQRKLRLNPSPLRCTSQWMENVMCMKCGREVGKLDSIPVEEGFFHGCRMCLPCHERALRKAEREANGNNFVLMGKQLVLR